jgi:hypothetical protein
MSPGGGSTGRAGKSSCAVKTWAAIMLGRGGEWGGFGSPGPSPQADKASVQAATSTGILQPAKIFLNCAPHRLMIAP